MKGSESVGQMGVCAGANSVRSKNLQSESETPCSAYIFLNASPCNPIAMLSPYESSLITIRKQPDCNAIRLLSDCKILLVVILVVRLSEGEHIALVAEP